METVNNIIENHLQGEGGHIHIGHGKVHHVGVGVVHLKRRRNSSRLQSWLSQRGPEQK